MVEELQSLLDRIQKDGVEQAEARAGEILAKANDKARAVVVEAERKAADILSKAEADSHVFTERSTKTLEQVARDFLIGIQKDVQALFRESARGAVGEALTPETMAEMMVKLAKAYGEKGLREDRIDVLLSPEDQDDLVKLFMNRYRDELAKGIEIHPDKSIRKGFRVSFKDDKLYHDFTQEAISDSVSELLKSPLKEIVARAAENAEENA